MPGGGIDRIFMAEGNNHWLRPTGYRPGQLALCCRWCSAWQDKVLQWWQTLIMPVQGVFHPFDVIMTDHSAAGDGKLASQIEQVVLDTAQAFNQFVVAVQSLD